MTPSPPRAIFRTSLLLLLLVLCPVAAWGADPAGTASAAEVYWLDLRGPLIPGLDRFLETAIQQAESANAQAIIVALDSPGGLESALTPLLTLLASAQRPVVLLIPAHARASATAPYLALGADLILLGEGSRIGPTVPLRFAQSGSGLALRQLISPAAPSTLPGSVNATEEQLTRRFLLDYGADSGREAITALVAQSLLVRIDAPKTANGAIVQMRSTGATEVLQRLDGQQVIRQGQSQTLFTASASVTVLRPSWYLRLGQIIADPLVILILLLIGVVGIIAEFLHPGGILPGVLGALSLLTAIGGMLMLPVVTLAVAALILGTLFIMGEAKIAGPGLLGVPGTIAFVWGAVNLIPPEYADLRLNLKAMLFTGGLILGLGFLAVRYIQKELKRRPVTGGLAGIIGELGEVREALDPDGMIYIHGEYWSARLAEGLEPSDLPVGAKVRVLAKDGPQLLVAPVE